MNLSHHESGPILIFQDTLEMKRSYDSALREISSEVLWSRAREKKFSLTSNVQKEPLAVIIDLDMVEPPLQSHFQSVRLRFPRSVLIALSSSDSSQTALQCVRSGFSDFLLKPVTPEELSWSIKKSIEQKAIDARSLATDFQEIVARAIRQLSAANSAALVQLFSLESLQALFQAKGAAWLGFDGRGPEHTKILCATPNTAVMEKVLFEFPYERVKRQSKRALLLRGKTGKFQRIVLPCRDFPKSAVYLWGMRGTIHSKLIVGARTILDHAHTCIINLQKFEEVRNQTFVDDLTGLYNSRYLKFALTNAISRCRSPNRHFSLLFVDVDHFKAVNDSYGHLIGSAYLVAIGRTLRNLVRIVDPVFRYGGDEFIVLLNDANANAAYVIAERIRRNVEKRVFVVKGVHLHTTVSIGIASFPEHTHDREHLLRLADEAMYSAKRASRNAVHLTEGLITKPIPKNPARSRPQQH